MHTCPLPALCAGPWRYLALMGPDLARGFPQLSEVQLQTLTQPRVFLTALPLKLAAGDGCPVRAFAYDSSSDSWPHG